MMARFGQEYEFALANPDRPACRLLLQLAQMYARHADAPTLGLMEGAASDVRKEMEKTRTVTT